MPQKKKGGKSSKGRKAHALSKEASDVLSRLSLAGGTGTAGGGPKPIGYTDTPAHEGHSEGVREEGLHVSRTAHAGSGSDLEAAAAIEPAGPGPGAADAMARGAWKGGDGDDVDANGNNARFASARSSFNATTRGTMGVPSERSEGGLLRPADSPLGELLRLAEEMDDEAYGDHDDAVLQSPVPSEKTTVTDPLVVSQLSAAAERLERGVSDGSLRRPSGVTDDDESGAAINIFDKLSAFDRNVEEDRKTLLAALAARRNAGITGAVSPARGSPSNPGTGTGASTPGTPRSTSVVRRLDVTLDDIRRRQEQLVAAAEHSTALRRAMLGDTLDALRAGEAEAATETAGGAAEDAEDEAAAVAEANGFTAGRARENASNASTRATVTSPVLSPASKARVMFSTSQTFGDLSDEALVSEALARGLQVSRPSSLNNSVEPSPNATPSKTPKSSTPQKTPRNKTAQRMLNPNFLSPRKPEMPMPMMTPRLRARIKAGLEAQEPVSPGASKYAGAGAKAPPPTRGLFIGDSYPPHSKDGGVWTDTQTEEWEGRRPRRWWKWWRPRSPAGEGVDIGDEEPKGLDQEEEEDDDEDDTDVNDEGDEEEEEEEDGDSQRKRSRTRRILLDLLIATPALVFALYDGAKKMSDSVRAVQGKNRVRRAFASVGSPKRPPGLPNASPNVKGKGVGAAAKAASPERGGWFRWRKRDDEVKPKKPRSVMKVGVLAYNVDEAGVVREDNGGPRNIDRSEGSPGIKHVKISKRSEEREIRKVFGMG